jgi:hypothetical protein
MNGNEQSARDEVALPGGAPDEIPAARPAELGDVPVINYASGVPRAMSTRAKVAMGLGIAGLSVVVGGIVYVALSTKVVGYQGAVAPRTMNWSQQSPGVSSTATPPAKESSGEEQGGGEDKG